MTVILFLIILSALVFVHELGHFLVAKKAGIRVDAFAIGFPPKIYGKKVGETQYDLNLIPFGGYVKIYGEDGEENADLTQTNTESPLEKGVPESARAGVVDNPPAEDGSAPFIKGDSRNENSINHRIRKIRTGPPSSAQGRFFGDAVFPKQNYENLRYGSKYACRKRCP